MRNFELTTVFRGLSQAKDPKALAKTKAHIRYITRASADPLIVTSSNIQPTENIRATLYQLAEERAAARKNGRVCEKLVLSLPNELSDEDSMRCISGVISLVTKDQAKGIGVLHRDKENNRHAHFVFFDEPESIEQAKQRNPNAKRVRRQDVIRLGELGRPEELRDAIGEYMTAFCCGEGYRVLVETRSFAERGITQVATGHEGPERRARLQRTGEADDLVAANQRIRAGRTEAPQKAVEAPLSPPPLLPPQEAPQRPSEALESARRTIPRTQGQEALRTAIRSQVENTTPSVAQARQLADATRQWISDFWGHAHAARIMARAAKIARFAARMRARNQRRHDRGREPERRPLQR